MATAGNEIKPKKGGGNGMYVYKFDTSSHQTPAKQEKPPKKISWGLRRSKTVREVVNNHDNVISSGRNSVAGDYDEKQIVVEAARKSTSSVASAVAARKSESAASVGSRKSVSYLEVNVAAVAALLQVKILVTDMPGFMQVHAFRCARTTYDSLEKFSPRHMAYNLKKDFDKVYGPAWHCIVGSSFGSFVTHSTGCFLYFSMEKLYILVFKTKVLKTLHQP